MHTFLTQAQLRRSIRRQHNRNQISIYLFPQHTATQSALIINPNLNQRFEPLTVEGKSRAEDQENLQHGQNQIGKNTDYTSMAEKSIPAALGLRQSFRT